MGDGAWRRHRFGIASVAPVGLDAPTGLVVLEGHEGAGTWADVGDRALAHRGDDTREAVGCDRHPFVARLPQLPCRAQTER
jgi:hypothetical protein